MLRTNNQRASRGTINAHPPTTYQPPRNFADGARVGRLLCGQKRVKNAASCLLQLRFWRFRLVRVSVILGFSGDLLEINKPGSRCLHELAHNSSSQSKQTVIRGC